MARPKVLQIAFACNPEGHGEHWLGWGWVEQAHAFCDVQLIAFPRHREQVTRGAAELGIPVHFAEIPGWLDRLCFRFDLAGRWIRQVYWQRCSLRLAAKLHAREAFDLVHQTTFHSFRVPFAAASLGIPSVWGPIAGGENVPPGFGRYIGPARWPEALRPWLNRLWLAAPFVRRSLRQASALLVSNRTTLQYLPAWCRPKARIVPPNALRDDLPEIPARPPATDGPLRLLYVGNCVGTRSIPLVLHAMRAASDVPCQFTIAGTGNALASWRTEATRLGLDDRITFLGHVERGQLAELYRTASCLVFPGLRDSGGSALLEAMSLGVPVVCLDWGGPGEMVDEASGIKVPVTSPASTIAALGDAFRRLHAEPTLGPRLGLAGAQRCRKLFTWEGKRRLLESVYREVLGDAVTP